MVDFEVVKGDSPLGRGVEDIIYMCHVSLTVGAEKSTNTCKLLRDLLGNFQVLLLAWVTEI